MAKPDNAGAGSTDYMHMFGLVVLGYMWAKMKPRPPIWESLAAGSGDADYFKNKLLTGRFFMEKIMPETASRKIRIEPVPTASWKWRRRFDPPPRRGEGGPDRADEGRLLQPAPYRLASARHSPRWGEEGQDFGAPRGLSERHHDWPSRFNHVFPRARRAKDDCCTKCRRPALPQDCRKRFATCTGPGHLDRRRHHLRLRRSGHGSRRRDPEGRRL